MFDLVLFLSVLPEWKINLCLLLLTTNLASLSNSSLSGPSSFQPSEPHCLQPAGLP